jgi:hypothetical protein
MKAQKYQEKVMCPECRGIFVVEVLSVGIPNQYITGGTCLKCISEDTVLKNDQVVKIAHT